MAEVARDVAEVNLASVAAPSAVKNLRLCLVAPVDMALDALARVSLEPVDIPLAFVEGSKVAPPDREGTP